MLRSSGEIMSVVYERDEKLLPPTSRNADEDSDSFKTTTQPEQNRTELNRGTRHTTTQPGVRDTAFVIRH